MMLFWSMKTTQRSKKFGKMGHEGVQLFWGGKGREGRCNFRHAFSFLWNSLEHPVYGICCSKDQPKNVQSKGDLCAAFCLSDPFAGCNVRIWAAPTWEHLFRTSFRGQGKWIFQQLLLPEAFSSKAAFGSGTLYGRSFHQGGCLLQFWCPTQWGAQVRMSERRSFCAREAPW